MNRRRQMPAKTAVVSPKRSLAHHLRRLLAAEGYRPRLEKGDGDPSTLFFKVESNEYLLRCSGQDPEFIQLCTGYSLAGTTQDELTLLRAASEVQNDAKVAKVYIPPTKAYVEFQLELFLGGHPLSPELLERSIATLKYTCREFYKRVIPDRPQACA
jgi:hypothetical protein